MTQSKRSEKKPGAGRHERRRQFEFSKLIVVLAIVMWIAVNVFGMVMMAITMNLSPLVYVIGSVDAVMAVVCGFYSYKAKAENMIKLKKLYGVDTSGIAGESADTFRRNYHQYDYSYYPEAPMYEDASIV